VYTAESGAAAIDCVGEMGEDLDIALLDRRSPESSGDEVLNYIQSRSIDCRTAMVAAVDPTFDIIDMGFDDYVIKPMTTSDLRDVIERLLAIDEHDETYQQLSEKRVKRSVLAAEKSRSERRESDELARLQKDIEALKAELESIESEIEGTPLPQ
jgi:response regulator RpfG family c-di-GMP phosphodiesterase